MVADIAFEFKNVNANATNVDAINIGPYVMHHHNVKRLVSFLMVIDLVPTSVKKDVLAIKGTFVQKMTAQVNVSCPKIVIVSPDVSNINTGLNVVKIVKEVVIIYDENRIVIILVVRAVFVKEALYVETRTTLDLVYSHKNVLDDIDVNVLKINTSLRVALDVIQHVETHTRKEIVPKVIELVALATKDIIGEILMALVRVFGGNNVERVCFDMFFFR